MAIDYASKRSLAERLITNAGQSSQVIKKGLAAGNDSEGNYTPGTPDVTIDGIVTPIFMYKLSEIDGERVQAGDGYVFFHSDEVPEINSTIEINSIEYRILDIPSLTSVDGINIYRRSQLGS